MDRKLSSADKFNLQQNFRRFLKFQDQYEEANTLAKQARASRVWVAGVVALLFALASDFFFGLFCRAIWALFLPDYYRLDASGSCRRGAGRNRALVLQQRFEI